MSSRLVIAGAGGFGRELLSAVTASHRFIEEYAVEEIVYVDDAIPTVPVRRHIIGSISAYEPQANDWVLPAVGQPDSRRNLVNVLRQRSARFATFIHDRAIVGDGVVVGEGTVVCADVRLTADVILGDFIQVNVNCSIGHDVEVGDFTTFSANCDLTGGVKVGKSVFFGTAVAVAPGKHIGDGASIGMGSVVIRSVRSDTTVFGNPAREIAS